MKNPYSLLSCLTIVAIYLVLHNAVCDAKVINAETSSSYMTKVTVGFVQSCNWLWDFMFGRAIDRPPRKVKLALVGLGRTGSTSFVTALKQMGYTPIHDDEAPEVSDIYAAVMEPKDSPGFMTMDEVNIQLGKRGFDAPWISLPQYVEWAANAPDVKVILTTRDKSKWAKSWLSVTPAAFLPYQRPFCWIKSMRELAPFHWEVTVNIPTNYHPELYEDVPTLEEGFQAWTEYVKKTVPREKLLVFDVRQGWGPLCDFLDEPVPDGPFPHVNDRVVINVIVKVFVALTWVWPLLFAMPLLVAYYIVRKCRTRKKQKSE